MRSHFVLLVTLIAAGCSSIPDVTFESTDAAAAPEAALDSGGSSGSSGTSSSGSSDASSDTTSGSPSCSDVPPPAGQGVCCGPAVCLKCDQADCDACRFAACLDGDVCCKNRGSGRVECRKTAACNLN